MVSRVVFVCGTHCTQCVPTVATRVVGAKIYRPSVLVIAHLAETTDLIAHLPLTYEVDLLTPLGSELLTRVLYDAARGHKAQACYHNLDLEHWRPDAAQ